MQTLLTEVEVRALGALVEKQLTTPEYYPLTLNALVQACNQKSNRNPVVSFDEETVARAIESLRAKNLAYVFYGSTSRVPKYKQMMTEIFGLSPRELAIMCVLMLRGPQTPGELRARTERLYDFSGLEEVEETLALLGNKDPEPLVSRLPRHPGQKEIRYIHLLAGEVPADYQAVESSVEMDERSHPVRGDRTRELEQEVAALRQEVNQLRNEFEEFKKQFD